MSDGDDFLEDLDDFELENREDELETISEEDF